MFKWLLINFFFLLAIVSSFGQTQSNNSPAELLAILKKSRPDTGRVEILLQLCSFYLYKPGEEKQDLDSAMLLAQQARALGRSLHFDDGYQEASFFIGNTFIERNNISAAIVILPNLKDIYRARLLLMLGAYYIFKPGENKTDLDSSFIFLQQAKNLSDAVHAKGLQQQSLEFLGRYYFKTGNVNQGKACFTEIINDVSKTENKEAQVEWWKKLARLILAKDSTGLTRVNCYEKIVLLFRQLNNKEKETWALKDIADTHMIQGKLGLAERELLDVLEKFKSIGYRNLHYTYDLLAVTNRYKGDYNKGLSYALQTIKSMEETGDSVSAYTFYGRLAHMYRELGQTEKSIEWFQKMFREKKYNKPDNFYMFRDAGFFVRALIKQKKEKEALAFILDIANLNTPDGDFARASLANTLAYCYNALQQYGLAEKYYLEVIGLADNLEKNNEITSDVHYDIGKFYLERKQYNKAGHYLKTALDLPPGINTISTIKDIHLMLFRADSASGNYLSAIDHLQQHKAINDSIFSETKSKQIEELEIGYETAKKEHDIQLLQSEKELQQNKLQNTTLTKNLTFGGIALLLIIVGLLLNRYRLKQRSNRKLELQQKEINQKNLSLQNLIIEQEKLLQEKEWLLKEVHHRVKNNLQMVMSLLNTQSMYLENEAAVSAIRDSQHRMQAISLIHKKLYQTDNTAVVDMPTYINELVNYLKDSFAAGSHIHFEQNIVPVKMDVAYAVPLGLILNEAISNAIKYAFPDNRKGVVTISMQHQSDHHFLLTIADDGMGLPGDFDIYKSNSLGINLMQGLSKQLNGSFKIASNNGLLIIIDFTNDKPMKSGLKSPAIDLTSEIPDHE